MTRENGSLDWLFGLVHPSNNRHGLCVGASAVQRVAGALIVALPPVGLIGWANPLTRPAHCSPGPGGVVLTLVGG